MPGCSTPSEWRLVPLPHAVSAPLRSAGEETRPRPPTRQLQPATLPPPPLPPLPCPESSQVAVLDATKHAIMTFFDQNDAEIESDFRDILEMLGEDTDDEEDEEDEEADEEEGAGDESEAESGEEEDGGSEEDSEEDTEEEDGDGDIALATEDMLTAAETLADAVTEALSPEAAARLEREVASCVEGWDAWEPDDGILRSLKNNFMDALQCKLVKPDDF